MQSVTTLCRQAERTSGWETGEERLYETRTVWLGFKCWCTIIFQNKKKKTKKAFGVWLLSVYFWLLTVIYQQHLLWCLLLELLYRRTHFCPIDDLRAAFWLLAEKPLFRMSYQSRQAHYQRGKYVFTVVILYTFMLLKGKIFFLWQSVSQVQLI